MNHSIASPTDFPFLDEITVAVRSGNPSLVTEQIVALKKSVEPFLPMLSPKSIDARRLLENRIFVKSLSFLADAEYIRGHFAESARLVEAAANHIRHDMIVSQAPASSDSERRLRRQQVWLLTCYAAACIRIGERKIAGELLALSESFVNRCLRTTHFPCYGTRARIEFYNGLLARNAGHLNRARRCFDRATEMAINRCEHALLAKGRNAAYREAEVLFKKRCLAMVHAFGNGLSSMSEGKLLSARASFYLALELLQAPRPEAAGEPLNHDEVMAAQVWTWLILVQTMLIDFSKEGQEQLDEMSRKLGKLRMVLTKQTGNFEPDLQLCEATAALIQLRKNQALPCNRVASDPFSAAPPPAGSPGSGSPYPKDARPETDLPRLITSLVQIWVAIDSDPCQAYQMANQLDTTRIDISFWRNEVTLAASHAKIEEERGRMEGADPASLSEIEHGLLNVIDSLNDQLPTLTAGQTIFASVAKAQAFNLLVDCSRGRGEGSGARAKTWHRSAAAITVGLQFKPIYSGILKSKIHHLIGQLPPGYLPARLPMPYEVGYKVTQIDLFLLIAGRNCIVDVIAGHPELRKKALSRLLEEKIGLTPQRAMDYCAAFPELHGWLVSKGKLPSRAETNRVLVDDYQKFLNRRELMGTSSIRA